MLSFPVTNDLRDEIAHRWRRRCARLKRDATNFKVVPSTQDMFRFDITEDGFIQCYYEMRPDGLRYAGQDFDAIHPYVRSHFIWGCPDARIVNMDVANHLRIDWDGPARFQTPRRFHGWRLHVREHVGFRPVTSNSHRPLNIKVVWGNKGVSRFGPEDAPTLTFHVDAIYSGVRKRNLLYIVGTDLSDEDFIRVTRLLPSARREGDVVVLSDTDMIHLKLMMET